MKNLQQKFHLLFKPFLLIGICFISTYTFLHWWLTIKTNTILWHEDAIYIYAPTVFLLPILLKKFWKPSKVIQTSNTTSPLGGLVMFPFLTIMAANAFAQAYLVTNTGVLTTLENIDIIDSLPRTKYYNLKHYYIDSLSISTKYVAQETNKNRDLSLDIYVVCPIYKTDPYKNINEDTTVTKIGVINSEPIILDDSNSLDIQKRDSAVEPPHEIQLYEPKAWYCKAYRKTIDNHLPLDEEKALKHEFYKNSISDFKLITKRPFMYLDQIGLSREYYKYNEAIETELNKSATTIILEPRFEPFDERNGNKLFWIFGAFAIGAAIHFLVIFFLKLDEEKLEAYLSNSKGIL